VAVALASPSVFAQANYGPAGAGMPPSGGFGIAPDCNDPMNTVANCGFESGSFASWNPVDNTNPFFPLQVGGAGVTPGFGFFSSAPTEGALAALHGFDAGDPGGIQLSQDVTVPAGGGTLNFDYRAAWDLASFGATLDRRFEVHVEPSGGGGALQTDVILTAPAFDLTPDTGDLEGIVDLSAFAGQAIRVNFVWVIPESFSGPGFFQLDNVSIGAGGGGGGVPAMGPVAVIVTLLLLGITSFYFLKRQRRQTT
jgi:hypothetical protein